MKRLDMKNIIIEEIETINKNIEWVALKLANSELTFAKQLLAKQVIKSLTNVKEFLEKDEDNYKTNELIAYKLPALYIKINELNEP